MFYIKNNVVVAEDGINFVMNLRPEELNDIRKQLLLTNPNMNS